MRGRRARGLTLPLSLYLSRPLQHHGSQCATLETGAAYIHHWPDYVTILLLLSYAFLKGVIHQQCDFIKSRSVTTLCRHEKSFYNCCLS